MNNTKYVSPKESAYCPECKRHPQQMRTHNHAERICSDGHTFTLKQSREAEHADADLGNEAQNLAVPSGQPSKDKVESADLTGKTMSAYPYVFTNDDGILVFRAEFMVCEPCVLLKGQECHTPECVFCFQPVSVARSVLNKTLNCPIINGERLILLPHTQDTDDDSGTTTVPDESPLLHKTGSSESSPAQAAALEIAERWLKHDLPIEAQVQSLALLQLSSLAEHVIFKHLSVVERVEVENQDQGLG